MSVLTLFLDDFSSRFFYYFGAIVHLELLTIPKSRVELAIRQEKPLFIQAFQKKSLKLFQVVLCNDKELNSSVEPKEGFKRKILILGQFSFTKFTSMAVKRSKATNGYVLFKDVHNISHDNAKIACILYEKMH